MSAEIWLANRLTSYDEEMHKEILEDFFTDDAKYVSPVLVLLILLVCLPWLTIHAWFFFVGFLAVAAPWSIGLVFMQPSMQASF